MKYLKCNDCNHFNHLNSEYQIFCNACGKKLTHNFKDWQKKNPSKDFTHFKQDVGVEKVHTASKKKTSFKKYIQIGVIVLFSVIGSYFGKKYAGTIFISLNNLLHPVSDVLNEKWNRCFFMGNQVSIETPYVLEESNDELPIPEEVKKLITSIHYYKYQNLGGFASVFLTATYDKRIVKININNAADSGISQAVREVNGTDVFYNDEQTTINGYPTVIKKGTFKKDIQTIYFKTITSVKNDLTIISLITFWMHDNQDYDLLTDRMINSLIIE